MKWAVLVAASCLPGLAAAAPLPPVILFPGDGEPLFDPVVVQLEVQLPADASIGTERRTLTACADAPEAPCDPADRFTDMGSFDGTEQVVSVTLELAAASGILPPPGSIVTVSACLHVTDPTDRACTSVQLVAEPGVKESECATDTDCPEGLFCDLGMCTDVPICDGVCPSGEPCGCGGTGGGIGGGPGTICSVHSDCPRDQVCTEFGFCDLMICGLANPCPDGAACHEGMCVGVECKKNADCGEGAHCRGQVCELDGPLAGVGCASGGGGGLLASLLLLALVVAVGGRRGLFLAVILFVPLSARAECITDADCPQGTVCDVGVCTDGTIMDEPCASGDPCPDDSGAGVIDDFGGRPTPCTVDADCGGRPLICDNGGCAFAYDCSDEDPCADGYGCVEGLCRWIDCRRDAQCAANETCVDYACKIKPPLESVGGCEATVASGEATWIAGLFVLLVAFRRRS